MDKIRILRIIARLNIGGPAVQAAILTKELNDNGFESMLVTGVVDKGEEEMTFLLNEYGVKPVYIPEIKREIDIAGDITAIAKLCKLMRQYRPHIVHTHTSKAGFIGRIAAFLSGVPVKVHTFHGHTFHSYFSPAKSALFLRIERILAALTDTIITISPLQYDDVVKRYKVASDAKCKVISLGLDLDKYLNIDVHPRRKSLAGIDKDDIVVGTVGRMTAIKNHRLFIDVAKFLRDSDPSGRMKFVMVGDGDLKDELVRYRDSLGLKDRVLMFGWQDDLSGFYSAFDIFMLTSRNEGTPVSMIEAMASGIPVVSSSVGGVPDILKDGISGHLVKDLDKAGFVRAVKALSDDVPLRKNMGENGREAVRGIFDKRRLVSDIRALYEELITKKGVRQ